LLTEYFIPASAERDKIEEIIDARTSDAILALRFNAPIYTYKNILDKAGIYLNSQETDKDSQEIDDILSNPETFGNEGKQSIRSSY
jgi:bifunctional DNase/RNase